MSNIFDGLYKLDYEQIINQIAVLETINRINLSKPMFQKAVKKAVNVINYVGNKLGKDPNVKEPAVKEIWTMLEESKRELRDITREELNLRLKKILMDKCKVKFQAPSDDELSIAVLEECCKSLKISPKLMPSVKADMIYEKCKAAYNNEENKEENVNTEIIDESISFLKLGKKFDRQQLIKFTCMCIKAYGHEFAPKDEDMPSYVNDQEKMAVMESEKAIEELRNEIAELKKRVNNMAENIKENEKIIRTEKKAYTNLTEIQNTASKEIADLKKIKEELALEKEELNSKISLLEEERVNASLDKLDEIMKIYEEIKLRIFDINTSVNSIVHDIVYKEQLINNCLNDCNEKEKIIRSAMEEKEKNEASLKELSVDYNEKKEILYSVENKKKEDIILRWNKFFNNFIFNESDLQNIVKYNNDELISIEKCMWELDNTKDPQALSIGIVKDGTNKYEYIEIIDEKGFHFEIWYEVFENANKNIHIKEIYS